MVRQMMMFYAVRKDFVRFPIPNATNWKQAVSMVDSECVELVCCEYELVKKTRRRLEKGKFVDTVYL